MVARASKSTDAAETMSEVQSDHVWDLRSGWGVEPGSVSIANSTAPRRSSTSAAACACAAEGNRADKNREFALPPSSVSRYHAGRRPLRRSDMDISSFLRKEPLNKLLAPNHTQ